MTTPPTHQDKHPKGVGYGVAKKIE